MECRIALLFAIFTISFMEISPNQVYTLIHEKAELVSYNESMVAGDVIFSFRKVNKTDFAFNASFTSVKDFHDRKIMLRLAADKLFGGEYKRTGSSLTVNICKFYEKNTFGVQDLFKQNSNFEFCDIPKGFYYIRNFIPDPKLFPKFIPFGSYRLIIHLFHDGTEPTTLFTMNWYARIEKKIKY